MESPAQTFPGPEMTPGRPTVNCIVAAQPDDKVYEMVVVPKAIPFTIPVPDPMVALAVTLLVQVPPADELVSVTVAPGHTDELPVIVAGDGSTVNTSDPVHPPVVVKEIVDVPELMAVITPVELIVATEVFDEVQVPPEMLAVTVSVLPAQVPESPVIVTEHDETDILFVLKQPEGSV